MIIHHHLGLGDHFVCNGLVNYLSYNRYVHLICKNHNLPTIKSLYSENKNVNVIGIDGKNEITESHNYSQKISEPVLYIGFNNCNPNNWDKSFYDQLSLDFSIRYDWFRLPSILPPQLYSEHKEYIFVHNESSDKKFELNISSNYYKFIAQKQDTNNLLSYITLLKLAKEIHCIDSSIFHLVDSITDNTYNNLYYHNIRRHPCNFTVSKKWNIVSYE
jgi:hypothetical protein